MVGMFDAGLRAASLGGNYDKARALAGAKLEETKALPYNKPGGMADSAVEIYPPGTTACTGIIPSSFSCQVQSVYARADSSSGTIVTDPTARTMMQVTVAVNWGGGKLYSTTGIITK